MIIPTTSCCHNKEIMDIIKKFKLPSYLKGKSFAQASKALDDRFKDRTDPESLQTLNEMQQRLQQAQEYVKSEQMKMSQPKSQEMMGEGMQDNSFGYGGYKKTKSNKYELGGLMDLLGKSGNMDKGLGMISSVADMANTAVGDSGIDTSGKTTAPDVNVTGATIGGAMKGAKAGMALGPVGAAGGALLGGVSSLFGANKAKRDAEEARFNNTASQRSASVNSYKKGGPLDPTG